MHAATRIRYRTVFVIVVLAVGALRGTIAAATESAPTGAPTTTTLAPSGSQEGGAPEPSPPAAGGAQGSGADDRSWIVTLAPGAVGSARQRALEAAEQEGGRIEHVYTHVIQGFSFVGSEQAAEALARRGGVAAVEEDRSLHLAETVPFGSLRIDGWAAHQAGYDGRTVDGSSVRVAVIDSGIDLEHSDLAANISMGEAKNCVDPGQPPVDVFGHGTHVAGTIAAAFNGDGVVGVAPNATIVPIKVIDASGNGSDSQVICGLDHAASLPGPLVVNMSIGEGGRPGETSCDSSALHEAVCGLSERGAVIVAAAGNDGTDAAGFVPAAFPEVIAVSAFTDFDGARSFAGCQFDIEFLYQCDDHLAAFSNYGSTIDVTAPGVHILSTWNDGSWQTSSGTSMASPHVAGVAALVLAADPTLSPGEVKSILQSTGECPDGSVAAASTCAGHGQWMIGSMFGSDVPDPDGVPEPLVNALLAAQAAAGDVPPPPSPPPYESAPQGSWVGSFGSAGYVLAGWNNGTSDLSSLNGVSVTLEQGGRYCWVCSTTGDVRALQRPDQGQRRAAAYFHANQVRVRLGFAQAYAGTVRIYVVDWDSTTRREDVTVDDGTPETIPITTSVNQGAWLEFPVSVAANGSVLITATRTAGINAIVSGIFLGDAGPPYVPPPPSPPPYESAPQGSWVGSFGSAGYVLAGWNNGTSDLSSLNGVSVTLEQGGRYCWVCSTTGDVRALQRPDQGQRRAAAYFHANQVRVRLGFAQAYAGTVRIYVVDWDSTTRREDVTVDDGTPETIPITTSVNQGAWLEFPVSVAANGSVLITATRTAGINAIVSGIFLGDAGPPYVPPPPSPPPYESAPQGSWVGSFGSAGYVLAGWNNGTSDLSSLNGVSVTLEQGGRYCWVCSTTGDVRALQRPDQGQRRAAAYFHANQVRVRLGFAQAYAGTVRIYVVDWDSTTRREDVTVDDGTPETIPITTSVNQGAWLEFPVSVAANGSVLITATRTAGINAIVSGIFLD